MDARLPDEAKHARAERWIGWLTLGIGLAAGLAVALLHSWRWGVGIFGGAVLGWLNFHWLQGALDALKSVSTAQVDAPRPQVPVWTWMRFLGRYALIGLAMYVIFIWFNIPILSMLVGLCALGAATMAEGIYEVFRPAE
jgi:hypothetical protein